MPGFDGTGPQGQGPMTGRGEGYCAVPLDRSAGMPVGYAGFPGRRLVRRPWLRWFRPFRSFRRVARPFGGLRGRGLGRGRGRGRGRW